MLSAMKTHRSTFRSFCGTLWRITKRTVPKNRFTIGVYSKIRTLFHIQQQNPVAEIVPAVELPPQENPTFKEIRTIHAKISADSMGGSPLDKCYLMVYLARQFRLKTFVEIGVYRGKSLFSVAPAFIENGGKCYGIDPWLAENLRENELPDEIKKMVDTAADTTDFEGIYSKVISKRKELGMEDSIVLLRHTSEEAYEHVKSELLADQTASETGNSQDDTFIDMLHIDGNHDYKFVCKDAQLYIPHVRKGGIIVFDDVGWSGVRRVYDQVKKHFVVLYEDRDFAVLYQDKQLAQEMHMQPHPLPSWAHVRLLQTSLPAIMENVRFSQEYRKHPRRLQILAAIMTYNSAPYIEQCIRSILMQEGEFGVEIGVFDDASTDDTLAKVQALLPETPPHIHITIYPNAENTGYEKNYLRVFDRLRESNADFLTCIDGDDYLISSHRFQRHIDQLLQRPECALCFNRLKLYFQEEDQFQLWNFQDTLTQQIYTASDLIKVYFIGNGSCSTIRKNAACSVPMELYTEAKAGDWLSHLIYATKGDIAYLSEPMNVYRKHSQGVWSGISPAQQSEILSHSLAKFNKLTNYLFYSWLFNMQAELFATAATTDETMWDLTIVDDIFPHPVSGFRIAEFEAYLHHFKSLRIFCNGVSHRALGNTPYTDILAAYKQAHPEFAHQLIETLHPYSLPMERKLRTKLAYFCFLSNVYASLDMLERNQIPFVFELYPGGSFSLDDPQSDAMLEKVIRSPYFRRVIVTQDITRDYLLQKQLCTQEQIVEIFGVVTPEKRLKTIPQLPVGGDGSSLKVCFAAMRYTTIGEDKGYDVFLSAARRLAERYKNIEFHVAGSFDESVLPLNELTGRITFHGVLNNDALSEFLQGMDIIVSPNLNGRIQPGSFDGFPTGTCTEAGLNGVLIVCTDPLHLNGWRFKSGYEIEICEHDASAIAELITYYYHHRDVLRDVIQNQGVRIRQLYSTQCQIETRIRVLEEELSLCSQARKQ